MRSCQAASLNLSLAGTWMNERRRRPYAPVIRCDAIAVTFDREGRLEAIEHLEGAF